MKLNWKKTAVAALTGTALLIGSAGVAAADGAGGVASTGWDGVNDTISGQGSDTTYLMMQRLSDIYNSAPGCETDNASGSATLGQCILPPLQSRTDQKGNWDHDTTAEQYPVGSGAGIKASPSTRSTSPARRGARSRAASRRPTSSPTRRTALPS